VVGDLAVEDFHDVDGFELVGSAGWVRRRGWARCGCRGRSCRSSLTRRQRFATGCRGENRGTPCAARDRARRRRPCPVWHRAVECGRRSRRTTRRTLPNCPCPELLRCGVIRPLLRLHQRGWSSCPPAIVGTRCLVISSTNSPIIWHLGAVSPARCRRRAGARELAAQCRAEVNRDGEWCSVVVVLGYRVKPVGEEKLRCAGTEGFPLRSGCYAPHRRR